MLVLEKSRHPRRKKYHLQSKSSLMFITAVAHWLSQGMVLGLHAGRSLCVSRLCSPAPRNCRNADLPRPVHSGRGLSLRCEHFPGPSSLVPRINQPVIRIRHGRLPQPCSLAQRPACKGLRRVEHVIGCVVSISDPGVVATQGFPAIGLPV